MSKYKQNHTAYLTMHNSSNIHVNKLYDILSKHPMSEYLNIGPIFQKLYDEYMTKQLGKDYKTAKSNARLNAVNHVRIILNDIGYRLVPNWTDQVDPLPTLTEIYPHNQHSKPSVQ